MEPWLVNIIIGATSGVGTALLAFLLKWQPIQNKARMDQNEQLINAYKNIIDSHQKQIDVLYQAIHKLEEKGRVQDAAHAQCRAENEVLQKEVAYLKTQIEYLQVMRDDSLTDANLSADVVCDLQGNITEWDPAATLMFGWTRAEILRKPITMLIEESYVGRHQASFQAMLETKEKRPGHGIKHGKARNKLGDVFPVWVVLSSWNEKGERKIGATIRKDVSNK